MCRRATRRSGLNQLANQGREPRGRAAPPGEGSPTTARRALEDRPTTAEGAAAAVVGFLAASARISTFVETPGRRVAVRHAVLGRISWPMKVRNRGVAARRPGRAARRRRGAPWRAAGRRRRGAPGGQPDDGAARLGGQPDDGDAAPRDADDGGWPPSSSAPSGPRCGFRPLMRRRDGVSSCDTPFLAESAGQSRSRTEGWRRALEGNRDDRGAAPREGSPTTATRRPRKGTGTTAGGCPTTAPRRPGGPPTTAVAQYRCQAGFCAWVYW